MLKKIIDILSFVFYSTLALLFLIFVGFYLKYLLFELVLYPNKIIQKPVAEYPGIQQNRDEILNWLGEDSAHRNLFEIKNIVWLDANIPDKRSYIGHPQRLNLTIHLGMPLKCNTLKDSILNSEDSEADFLFLSCGLLSGKVFVSSKSKEPYHTSYRNRLIKQSHYLDITEKDYPIGDYKVNGLLTLWAKNESCGMFGHDEYVPIIRQTSRCGKYNNLSVFDISTTIPHFTTWRKYQNYHKCASKNCSVRCGAVSECQGELFESEHDPNPVRKMREKVTLLKTKQ